MNELALFRVEPFLGHNDTIEVSLVCQAWLQSLRYQSLRYHIKRTVVKLSALDHRAAAGCFSAVAPCPGLLFARSQSLADISFHCHNSYLARFWTCQSDALKLAAVDALKNILGGGLRDTILSLSSRPSIASLQTHKHGSGSVIEAVLKRGIFVLLEPTTNAHCAFLPARSAGIASSCHMCFTTGCLCRSCHSQLKHKGCSRAH
jgi:hypothetical protein